MEFSVLLFSDSEYVGGEIWKYRNGIDFGDIISVREGFEFKDKTITKGKDLKTNIYLCAFSLLVLKNPKNGELGSYIKKS